MNKNFIDNTSEMPENYSNVAKNEQVTNKSRGLIIKVVDDKGTPNAEQVKTLKEMQKRKNNTQ